MTSNRNDTNIKLAKSIVGALGENPSMIRHYDNSREHSIDILTLDDPLDNSNKFYSTIALSDIPTLINKKKNKISVSRYY